MLFSQKSPESEKPKQQSTLGFLFKPDIAGSIRPIGESVSVFVKLIAMIFSAQGLFPRNHPALTGVLPNGEPLQQGDPRARLTLASVIATAWSNLTFTKEALPQVLIFGAVLASLVLGVLMLLGVAMTVLSGKAHAASFFVPDDTTNDLAHNWLGFLFHGRDVQNLLVGPDYNQVPQDQAIQKALHTAMAYYSSAILVIAGLVLLYHLTHMIAETAHTGKVMGNANQIWAPIRLVFAIGLLVPISGGLNTGQYIMVKMAEWGSGLATNTWATFSTAIANRNATVIAPPTPQVSEVVQSLLLSYGCMYAYNYYIGQTYGGVTPLFGPGSDAVVKPYELPNEYGTTTTFGNKLYGQEEICGKYTINKVTTDNKPLTPTPGGKAKEYDASDVTLVKNTFKKINDSLDTIMGSSGTSVEQVAFTNMEKIIKAMQNGEPTIPTNDDFRTLVRTYRDSISTNLGSLYSTPSDVSAKLAEEWSKLGWMAAGAWLNTISRTQGAVMNATQAAMPIVHLPKLLVTNTVEEGAEMRGQALSAARALQQFNGWLLSAAPQKPITAEDFKKYKSDAQAGAPYYKGESGILTGIMSIVGGINKDLKLFDRKVGLTSNPFAELATTGHKSFIMAFRLLDEVAFYAGAASIFKVGVNYTAQQVKEALAADPKYSGWSGVATLSQGIATFGSNFANMLSSIAVLLSTLLFTIGLTLAFIIPLLPFTVFFFNILAWVVSVFEAVISMPLWALAHLTTKGEGIHGDMGKQGYFFILSIFLRPVLMVFGLVAGLLIFFVAIGILNMSYDIAAYGSGAWKVNEQKPDAFFTLSEFIYEALYGMFAYICANSSFKTVNHFAEHAMRWMSSQGVSTERMGDKSLMSTAQQAITAYGFRETLGTVITKNPGATLLFKETMGGSTPHPNPTPGDGKPPDDVLPDMKPTALPPSNPLGGGGGNDRQQPGERQHPEPPTPTSPPDGPPR